jgi:hypothetical protein
MLDCRAGLGDLIAFFGRQGIELLAELGITRGQHTGFSPAHEVVAGAAVGRVELAYPYLDLVKCYIVAQYRTELLRYLLVFSL